jgi:hypothetical protein
MVAAIVCFVSVEGPCGYLILGQERPTLTDGEIRSPRGS